MMKETNNESTGKVVVNVTYLVYLKGRDEPVNQIVSFELDPDHLETGAELESFMQIAIRHALSTLDVVREHRLILSDERFNKGIYLTDQIQAINILAPDEDNFLKLIEGN